MKGMRSMALIFKEQFRTLDSDSNYLRRKSNGEVFVDGIFLGKNDVPDDYEEISKEEYEWHLQELEAQAQRDSEAADEEHRRLQEKHENDSLPEVAAD